MRCHSTSFGRGIKKRVLMIRDNTENKNLPYDQTLGPLRQSRAIAANEINFNWWPKDFNGNTESTKIPRIILMMEGFSNFTVSTGENRILKSGDIIEHLDPSIASLKMETINSEEFRAAIIYLNPSFRSSPNISDLSKSNQTLPYVRNITGGDGRSHFQDGELAYYERPDKSLVTKSISITKFQYVYAAADLHYDFHNAPQRQIVLPLTGGTQGENGDGSCRIISAGESILGKT